eukprot:CAMPEP_0116022770 /NCGR_PEP_ID=MMETSP0321-20121206/11181_1 /TAXON_ID=163516 /ORGANISM="Leptocylindrus danicus var. danicus, Strain B650" /LENGTH=370 /DNA_ID=CAMNT_0003493897 /DNA_START=101 /DNA_END=1213 /DNA_ORIENTATION=+
MAASEVIHEIDAHFNSIQSCVRNSEADAAEARQNAAKLRACLNVMLGDNGAGNATKPKAATPKSRIITMPKVALSSEKIKTSHAEDVLALTLKIQELEAELGVEKGKNEELEGRLKSEKNRSLELTEALNIMCTTGENLELTEEMGSLQHELEEYKMRVVAAEEDAETAVELTKMCLEEKEALEHALQRAWGEIEMLKQGQQGQVDVASIAAPTTLGQSHSEEVVESRKSSLVPLEIPSPELMPPPPPRILKQQNLDREVTGGDGDDSVIGYSFVADDPDSCMKLAHTGVDSAPSSPLIQRRMWQAYPDDYGINHGPMLSPGSQCSMSARSISSSTKPARSMVKNGRDILKRLKKVERVSKPILTESEEA